VEGLKGQARHQKLLIGALLICSPVALASTLKLKIKTKHGIALEERKREQIERLAQQYDLKKYTLTRDIMIEQGAMNHSMPELTLNPGFLDDEDLALSAYIHEQGHWVIVERHRMDNPRMFRDLQSMFPRLPTEWPQGSGGLQDSYFHLVVCMLEWQGMEDLVGAERARRVIELKQRDHYTAIYDAVLHHRENIEGIMKRYGVKF